VTSRREHLALLEQAFRSLEFLVRDHRLTAGSAARQAILVRQTDSRSKASRSYRMLWECLFCQLVVGQRRAHRHGRPQSFDLIREIEDQLDAAQVDAEIRAQVFDAL